jgi:hypothetical protein
VFQWKDYQANSKKKNIQSPLLLIFYLYSGSYGASSQFAQSNGGFQTAGYAIHECSDGKNINLI